MSKCDDCGEEVYTNEKGETMHYIWDTFGGLFRYGIRKCPSQNKPKPEEPRK